LPALRRHTTLNGMSLCTGQSDRSAGTCEVAKSENRPRTIPIEPSEAQRRRFWRYVRLTDNEGCWLFSGAHTSPGYGGFKLGSRMVGAHRVAFTLLRGPIPAGLCVLHRCDVRACVRPSHLFLGTKGDNARDMVAKGRRPDTSGENHGNSKLTERDVIAIRRLAASGLMQAVIALRFGVAPATVNDVVRRRGWKHVPRMAELDGEPWNEG
jgi:hypothetical protein